MVFSDRFSQFCPHFQLTHSYFMKQISYVFSLVLMLSFGGCASDYLPFKTDICDNTFCFNTRYKTGLTLIEMSEILKKRSLNVDRDTFYSQNKKRYRTRLRISNYKIEAKEIMWIDFSVFELQKMLIFLRILLENTINWNKKRD